jgi:glycerol-3-phosphate dehydrogenase
LVAETVLRMAPLRRTGVIKMSQIIVRRLFETDNVYVFQNHDRRWIFASPYQRDFTLIGTIANRFKGDPAAVSMDADEVGYLCDAANRYFRERIDPSDVIRSVSGANTVADPAGRRLVRDGSVTFDARRGKAPLLTIFGGDVTTYRLRAERAVSRLTPYYPMSPRWTADAALPGGDFLWAEFEAEVERARDRWRFLNEDQARRLVSAYGSRLEAVLGDAKERADLGPTFGEGLTGAEVRYLMAREWARFPDDILWRRSKLGLTISPAGREALAAFMATADVRERH